MPTNRLGAAALFAVTCPALAGCTDTAAESAPPATQSPAPSPSPSGIAAILLLWLVIWGGKTWQKLTTESQQLVVLTPIICVVLILVVSSMLLSPGNSQPTWGL